ncbi:hypothetical protein AZ78_4623 [Lysobacter capsici AZ78]|uniref:Uncharacterized protein n=1 Tax=Lysobacter capsici AZ78 TaxID=1444315 RepID=A0A108UD74_9GAMM|nr:hypothetical protein AZ78_4623 [Lysobacter capsici AZ78]
MRVAHGPSSIKLSFIPISLSRLRERARVRARDFRLASLA